jgi:hypothetical protein
MYYPTVTLAVLGIAIGMFFKFRILLPVILLVALASILFSLFESKSFAETAITLITWQAALQGCYFLGLATRGLFSSRGRRVIL